MIYLASPYTHDDPAVRHDRYWQATLCTAHFARAGIAIYCPIHYGHTLSTTHTGIPKTHEYWMSVCLPILRGAERLYVLTLPGWKESRGIKEELDEAEERNLHVCLVDEDFNVRTTSYDELLALMKMQTR